MTRLANVTKFPHAQAQADLRRGHTHAEALLRAYQHAVMNFQSTYDRLPDTDILRFRGCTFTTGVLCEIWEEA